MVLSLTKDCISLFLRSLVQTSLVGEGVGGGVGGRWGGGLRERARVFWWGFWTKVHWRLYFMVGVEEG